MDIKQELKSWIELSSSYGYELLSDGNNAWRLTFANDLSMQIRIFREPDEMILSGANSCMDWLRKSFHFVSLEDGGVLLTKEQIYPRLKELCKWQFETEIKELSIPQDNRNLFQEAKVELLKSKIDLVSNCGTEEECVSRRRRGQNLLSNYLFAKIGRCQISGVTYKPLLVASHIKPWSECLECENERLDEENVLLLASNWDALFDKKFISFDPETGKMIKSKRISEEDLIKFGVPKDWRDTVQIPVKTERRKNYLTWHLNSMRDKDVSCTDKS